jgi:hypothetical protein
MSKFSITCLEFKPFRRNTLCGFATVRIAELHMIFKELPIHQKGERRWASLPARPQLNKEGVANRDAAGKIVYAALIDITDQAVREAFSAAVVRAVLDIAPSAFETEATPA